MPQFLQEVFTAFQDFKLLDTGDGYRLEQWGPYRLARPDPQIIWKKQLPAAEWERAHAIYHGSGEVGRWDMKTRIPGWWPVKYKLPGGEEYSFRARLTPFKHTGIFAEQAANWEWMERKLKGKKNRRILNLFGYTGVATSLLTGLGHQVTHIDASKPAIALAKENQLENGLPEDSIRWILDDAVRFVVRELKRDQHYDGILMDPPVFGHSPDGKVWKFARDLPGLLSNCIKLLSPDADFLLINGYATTCSAIALNNLLEDAVKGKGGTIDYGELCLPQQGGRLLSTGIFARWNGRE